MTRRHGRLDARRCGHGHVSLHDDPVCTTCGAPMHDLRIPADAVLELVTVVRINPSGQPYQLGVAITRAGRARTICRVEGAVRGLGTDAVVLERRDGIIVARRKRRLRERNRV